MSPLLNAGDNVCRLTFETSVAAGTRGHAAARRCAAASRGMEDHMGRNIVICCDGTNNEFGPENTSVVRLVQVLDRDPVKQRLYYEPGVGTLPEPGVVTTVGKKISQVFGLAFG